MAPLRCLGVIPARLKSTRLPGKPLKMIGNQSLIERVWRQASKASLITDLVIATDEQEIFEVARDFGAQVIMTGEQNITGSDRVAEAAATLRAEGQEYSLIANIQGDMPFINPGVIDRCIEVLAEADASYGMSTVAYPLTALEEFERPSSVKVVFGHDHQALLFSRAPIPFWRAEKPAEVPFGYKHMGLYVFRPEALHELTALPQGLVEKAESLEQLRALENGIAIKVAVLERAVMEPAIEVDTPEDLARAEEYVRR